jgi:uncharacterized protein YjbI with pentapeptide repeats
MQASDVGAAEFTDASLRETVLRECVLNGTRFSQCDLRGADLRKTMVTQAEFSDVQADGALYYGTAPWGGESESKDWGKELPTFDGE